jgi:ABC-type tungstate transport system permease subunit
MGKLSRVLLSLILLGLLNHNPVHGGEVNPLSMDEIQFRWRNRNVILATTTSTQDSGLLDVLVPLFQKQRGYTVKTVAVGTGQALALAAKGDADVALVHAPSLEKEYVAEALSSSEGSRNTVIGQNFISYNETTR